MNTATFVGSKRREWVARGGKANATSVWRDSSLCSHQNRSNTKMPLRRLDQIGKTVEFPLIEVRALE